VSVHSRETGIFRVTHFAKSYQAFSRTYR